MVMKKEKKSDILLAAIREGKPLSNNDKLSLIVSLSIPSILAQITSVLMFFIDAAMVGRLGTEATASVGLVESSTWLSWSLTSSASMGFSVQVAHFIGANDFVKAREVLRHGLICTLLLSLLVSVVGVSISGRLPFWLGGGADIAHDASMYFMVFMLGMPFFQLSSLSVAMLKCSGDMRIPSVLSVVMCLLDVCFNYLFIYICKLGVMGAALGTVLAAGVVSCAEAYFALFRNRILNLRQDQKPFKWVADYVRHAVNISAPMALQSVLMSGAQIVSTKIVAPLGNIAIGANTLAITAESLCYMPGHGIADAATTLVGQSIGADRKDLTKSFARLTVYIGMGVMAFMGAVMFVFAPEMMTLLTKVPEIQTLGIDVLRIEAFAEPMFGAAIVCYSVCVGAGDTLRPAVLNMVTMWGVRLTLAYVLAQDYGLRGVWFAMAFELIVRGILFLIRLFRGSWMNKISLAKTEQ